jgi:hypothetical protein
MSSWRGGFQRRPPRPARAARADLVAVEDEADAGAVNANRADLVSL